MGVDAGAMKDVETSWTLDPMGMTFTHLEYDKKDRWGKRTGPRQTKLAHRKHEAR